MKKTSLGLKKPEGTDLVNIQDMNDNMDVIEKELQARVKTTGDIKDTTVTFTQASSRANIATGEKTSTIMGKIKKWFADMTVAAFAQVITSNTDLMALTKSGYLVDALAVKNQFAEVNGKLGNLVSYISIPVAGKVISNNFAAILTNIDLNKYIPIGISEAAGGWTQYVTFSLLSNGYALGAKCTIESYTIPDYVKDVVIICINK